MKIISFSLWGQNPKYLTGAIRNAVLVKQIYPDWVCRFYVDNKVVKTEFYKGKSEAWAESAAENFVMGIKKL